MNKLVTLPIVNAVPMMPTDDKVVRLANEVKEAETRVRRGRVARNLQERKGLSKQAYDALCELGVLAGKLTRSRPATVTGLVAKASVAQLLDGYSEGFSAEIQKELARDVLRLLAPGTAPMCRPNSRSVTGRGEPPPSPKPFRTIAAPCAQRPKRG
ncbi:hypothetical protein [Bradyrhizobium sp. NC92]|uniref:hypothetical protein n=1 Tax=Bradyrhizobium sp. (strain NC92) TaxID=55395 RepID=UPI0021A9F60C|nr:hypothetical protein [Bradyrhizobium sp. NC92]UWU68205.1 hypothetical protein N2602_34775 [Bradyrhizobium sp. NC92]